MANESHPDKTENRQQRQLTGFKLALGYLVFLSSIIALVWLLIVEYPEFIEREYSIYPGFRIDRNLQGEVYIYDVFPKTEAELQNIEKGDVIVAVNGKSISPDDDLREIGTQLVGTYGDEFTISVRRGSEIRDIALSLGQDYLDTLAYFHVTLPLVMNTRFGLIIIFTICNVLASVVILVRHPRDWLAIILAIGLVNLPVSLDATWITYSQELQLLNKLQITTGLAFSMIALFLFPSGRVHIKRENILWAALGIWSVVYFCIRMGFISYSFVTMSIGIGGWVVLSGIGLCLQFKRPYTSVEQQQIKRAIFGIMTAVVLLIIYYLLFLYLADFVWNRLSYGQYRLVSQFAEVFLYFALALVEINMVLAFYRYKIWDTDFYINRTMVYTIITGLLAGIWWLGIVVLEYLIGVITDRQTGELPMVAAILSSVQVAALFKPIRDFTDKWVRNKFYKDRVDFTSALVELKPEMWEYIEVTALYEILTENVADLLDSTGAALYLNDSGQLRLFNEYGDASSDLDPASLEPENLDELKKGKVVKGKVLNDETQEFSLYIPLKVPRGKACDLMGVLSLAPRKKNRGYSRDHITDLGELGKHAGIAIHMLRLRELRYG